MRCKINKMQAVAVISFVVFVFFSCGPTTRLIGQNTIKQVKQSGLMNDLTCTVLPCCHFIN